MIFLQFENELLGGVKFKIISIFLSLSKLFTGKFFMLYLLAHFLAAL